VKITKVETRSLGFEKVDPTMARSFSVVRLETDADIVGWGEASTNWGHSYPTVIATTIRDVVAPLLVGKDPRNIRERLSQMHVALDGYLGWEGLTSQAIGAVEIALWDILGKDAGVSISQLLGGGMDRVRLFATGTTMFEQSADWHARYFDPALSSGITAVKVRLGKNPGADLELIETVRNRIGPDGLLMADAYWGYSPDQALALSRRMEPFDIYFFEEPCPQYMQEGLAWLSANSPVRIAVGERVYSPAQFADIARRGSARVFQPDAQICGGILACMDVATLARTADIEVSPHVGGPTAIGFAANLQWAAAAGVSIMEYDIDVYQPVLREILVDNLFAMDRITDGTIAVPKGPGLGIDVDEGSFERFPYEAGRTYAEMFPDHETGRA
jgi:L-alanine-DL-glutamate epimerase-like enolase superfamily enzyme